MVIFGNIIFIISCCCVWFFNVNNFMLFINNKFFNCVYCYGFFVRYVYRFMLNLEIIDEFSKGGKGDGV